VNEVATALETYVESDLEAATLTTCVP